MQSSTADQVHVTYKMTCSRSQMQAITSAAKVEVEPVWASLLAKVHKAI